MKETQTTYHCDVCNKLLESFENVVVTNAELGAANSSSWKRIRIEVKFRSGYNNDVTDDRDADLCQKCAHKLLKDATSRVRAGERVSAGINSIEAEPFNG